MYRQFVKTNSDGSRKNYVDKMGEYKDKLRFEKKKINGVIEIAH